MSVTYTDAREFFLATRRAAQDIETATRQLDRMRAAEGVRAQGYEPGVAHTRADVNGTGATIARIDWEGRMRERLESDYALVESAMSVIYGDEETGLGGVAALMGGAVADVLMWRCCRARDWRWIAAMLDRSESWCRESAAAAMDVCDAYGIDAMRRGLGIACEQ